MFTTHRRRSTSICTLACAALLVAACSSALAMPSGAGYYTSHEMSPAEAQAAYYSSYGAPQSQPAPAPVPSDGTPWLAIAASIAGALLIVGVSTTQAHRLRVRRRRAAGPAM